MTADLLLAEAREWPGDSFEDLSTYLTDAQVVDGIVRLYDGGWYQFVIDGRP